ncbi:MAG: homoserine O-succinyltransferase [Acetobacteraceae bacterium]|nr:homoserine O-succinyltransferase [Acetobacteraceae bacterium]
MPDAALLTTERQFGSLFSQVAEPMPVGLTCYFLPGIPRSEWAREYLAQSYAAVGDLVSQTPDVVIITGTEPREQKLEDEPYWDALTGLIDWAKSSPVPVMFSCLAAHAAVRHSDNIARHPVDYKCCGVFDEDIVSGHDLVESVGSRMPLPHSRWNEVRERALVTAGYTILSRGDRSGVGFFAKQQTSLWLLCQGHPEYEGASLLREYRRDVRRFLSRERASYPQMPDGFFDEPDQRRLAAFRESALARPDHTMMDAFPADIRIRPEAWRPQAVRLLRNWLKNALGTRSPSGERALVTASF